MSIIKFITYIKYFISLICLKRSLLFVVFSFLILTVFPQDTLIYKYFVGITKPDSGWENIAFKDSSWIQGHGPIGYGDNDNTIKTDTVVSVYIRYRLTVDEETIQKIKALVLYNDFDDGFIAYLNGLEILRVNMDDSIRHPGHLQTTSRSHEAEDYRFSKVSMWIYKPVQGYYFDSAQLQKYNLDTVNVLSFEVHNDSLKGSDLTFNFHYRFIDTNFEYNYAKPDSRFTAPVKDDSTRLPIIIVETSEFGVDTTSVIASMRIVSNAKGLYNKPNDIYFNNIGRIRLKPHGGSSILNFKSYIS